uniref:Uncharacterized protein n=1 Tax=Rhipicephalus zambeziensis TaxID=60191 RepID=A0A224Y9I5_9ACAR
MVPMLAEAPRVAAPVDTSARVPSSVFIGNSMPTIIVNCILTIVFTLSVVTQSQFFFFFAAIQYIFFHLSDVSLNALGHHLVYTASRILAHESPSFFLNSESTLFPYKHRDAFCSHLLSFSLLSAKRKKCRPQ